ncbi:MAG: hypothetical protein ACI82G_000296 [Bradymonadia bacterium]|jgi:hypothetical protein
MVGLGAATYPRRLGSVKDSTSEEILRTLRSPSNQSTRPQLSRAASWSHKNLVPPHSDTVPSRWDSLVTTAAHDEHVEPEHQAHEEAQ